MRPEGVCQESSRESAAAAPGLVGRAPRTAASQCRRSATCAGDGVAVGVAAQAQREHRQHRQRRGHDDEDRGCDDPPNVFLSEGHVQSSRAAFRHAS